MNLSILKCYVYVRPIEIHFGKTKGLARPWWTLPKIFFITFRRHIPEQYFYQQNFIWINPWPQGSLQKLFKDLWCTLYDITDSVVFHKNSLTRDLYKILWPPLLWLNSIKTAAAAAGTAETEKNSRIRKSKIYWKWKGQNYKTIYKNCMKIKHKRSIFQTFWKNENGHDFLFLFLTEEIQYHDGLWSRELGQAPILLSGPNT